MRNKPATMALLAALILTLMAFGASAATNTTNSTNVTAVSIYQEEPKAAAPVVKYDSGIGIVRCDQKFNLQLRSEAKYSIYGMSNGKYQPTSLVLTRMGSTTTLQGNVKTELNGKEWKLFYFNGKISAYAQLKQTFTKGALISVITRCY